MINWLKKIAFVCIVFTLKSCSPDAVSKDAELISFQIAGVNGTIDNGAVKVLIKEKGIRVSAITAAYAISPNSTISPDPNYLQDYSKTKTFVVTAGDGVTTKTYNVKLVAIPDAPYIVIQGNSTSTATISYNYVAGATSYEVFYSNTGYAGPYLSGGVGGELVSSFYHNDRPIGSTTYYKVTAINEAGTSDFSDIKSHYR